MKEDKEHQHLPLQGAFLLSSQLDSAVKHSSSEVLKLQRSCSVKGLFEETKFSEVLIRSEVVGVAKVANN